jgi:polysaccharide pyruvyl transferase WcaK-like protein
MMIPPWTSLDKIFSADMVVQAGAPVYWLNESSKCSGAEWVKPLWYKRVENICRLKPVINVAAGTCQPFFSDCLEIIRDKECREFITDIYNMCRFTTTREHRAHELLNNLGLENSLIPCSALFAADSFSIKPAKEKDLVCFNYMSLGGHYDLGQGIDYKKWDQIFFGFFHEIKDKHPVVLVCHNKDEYRQASSRVGKEYAFWARDYVDYLKLYSRCRLGVFNRIHGGFVAAGFLSPAIFVGADTRALMAQELNLPLFYVKDVNLELLQETFFDLEKNLKHKQEELNQIKKKAESAYNQEFEKLC